MTEHHARDLAVQILYAVDEEGAYTNLELDKALFSCELSAEDKGLVTELVYGTVTYRDHLDYVLAKYSNKPLKKLDSYTHKILRMALYQLIFLDRIPDHAVVSEAVNTAKRLQGKHQQADKFINAILRNYLKDDQPVKWPDKRKNAAGYLAKYYSFPQWIVDTWLKEYGKAGAEALCQYMNARPPLLARVNTLQIQPDALIKKLAQEGVRADRLNQVPEGLILYTPGGLRQVKSFQAGDFIIQDASSMLVAHALDPRPGEHIADLCAAPGGKTTHVAALMKDQGRVDAFDLHPHRVQLIKENRDRLGISSIEARVQDAQTLEAQGTYDRVLVDAPCSGLGVLNRRPDARWHRRRQQVPDLVNLQAAILDKAAVALKEGGTLLYSTCTTFRAENEDQCQHFLDRHPDFRPVPLPDLLQPYVLEGASHICRILPQRDRMDGFFIAKFRKVGQDD
ncbi:16S rRNA (cytosine(967)-C(5))-methyltransferase RsmB [Peptococcus simiae]|uniref:16S rRNA (cytosine(967)-C(5))-methyltransferase RsmB n=1 Tax=Peptococcus simiae TaxID=1643805 RepID=UPI00397F2371